MSKFDFCGFKRIILVGCMGSGKSWLSKRIAQITDYPLYHLDIEQWRPDWVKLSKGEQISRQKEIISGESWIIDGTWGGTMELRYAAADLIIYLEMNRFLCMWRSAKRVGKKRSDFPDFLEEKGVLSKEFFRFCKWIWMFPKNNKERIMGLHEKYPEKEFLHIKSRRDIKNLFGNQKSPPE